jgi:hypothetical protein
LFCRRSRASIAATLSVYQPSTCHGSVTTIETRFKAARRRTVGLCTSAPWISSSRTSSSSPGKATFRQAAPLYTDHP